MPIVPTQEVRPDQLYGWHEIVSRVGLAKPISGILKKR